MTAFDPDTVYTRVIRGLDSGDKLLRPPQGWDARDPAGCWTHDYKKGVAIDYTDGFRMFDTLLEATTYADTLDYNILSFDTVADKWTVTPLSNGYGC